MAEDTEEPNGNGQGKLALREAGTEYLIDLISELAVLARKYDEVPMAIHLEAIIAARRAEAPGRHL